MSDERLPATGANIAALQARLARYDAAFDRMRMERAQAEDAETVATERAEAAEATLAKVRELADEWADRKRSDGMSGNPWIGMTLAGVAADLHAVLNGTAL